MSRDNHMEKQVAFGSITKYFNVGISKISGTGIIKYEHNLDVLCDITFKNCPILYSLIGSRDYEQIPNAITPTYNLP